VTEQPQSVPPFDPANPYLQPVPVMVTMVVVDTPQGQRLGLTFRTPDATFTVFTDKQTGQQWHSMMGSHLEQMTSLTLAPANATLPPLR
jgi:hypothetical protein